MIYLNLFFHIYQPPNQDPSIINRIIEQSYAPLTSQFREWRQLKFTLNINYSLVEQLNRLDPVNSVLQNIKAAHTQGNLELTESGAYHPIFPLFTEREIKRQLDLNNKGNKQFWGDTYSPRGIFPPEMAFKASLAPIFKSQGYDWTVVDDANLTSYGIEIPYKQVYLCEGIGIFLRSNIWSNRFANYTKGQWNTGSDVVQELLHSLQGWIGNDNGYLIISLDGETFGHHHPELGSVFLQQFFNALDKIRNKIELAHLSDIYDNEDFEHINQFIPPCSWSTDEVNTQQKDFFSWWKSHKNKIHTRYWEFTRFVLNFIRRIHDDNLNLKMDKAIYSCQYWWASFWKFNPSEVYRGAFTLMRLLQESTAYVRNNYNLIEKGEDLFRSLIIEIEKEKIARRKSCG